MGFVPLYARIKERIRADILAAQAQPHGSRLPTERELQVRYGVSRPTISKALTALAAEGLLTKSQGRGSFALQQPSSEPSTSPEPPRRIGFVGPISGAELVQRIFRGIDRAAHHQDYRVLMGSAGQNVTRERMAALDLIASGACGLILYPVPRYAEEEATDYLRTESLGVPVVLVDTCAPQQGHAQVVFDNRRAGYAMMYWLLGKGNRRIGILSYTEHIHHPPVTARMQGYLDSLRDHGITQPASLIRRYEPRCETEALKTILEEWLASPEPPTAIIATEDMAALEVIDLLQHHGIRVPEDIRVVGFDNRESGRRYRPAFTTTNPDFEHMGEAAFNLLMEQIEAGETAPRTYVFEAPLLVRRSTDSLATPSREVALRS